MSPRWKSVLWAAAAFTLPFGSSPATAQNQKDMTFHTLPPCTVVDTRVAGGAFAANETRTYTVVGTGSLASQGGPASGCLVPGFSNGIAQVQAVALAFTSVSPAGSGYLAAQAADQTMAGSVLNYAAGDVLTNTAPVAVAQTSGVGDFKVLAAFNGTHVVVRVVGYYSKPVQVVPVHPVPGDHTASGTALLNAMSGITNATATKRYVIKLEPGIYDLGENMLTQKAYVDIEGSGQQATVIQGPGNNDGSLETAVVKGGSSAEIRDLQIKSAGQGYSFSIPLLIKQADTSVRNVTIVSDSASTNWGIRHVASTAQLQGVTLTVQGGSNNYGFSSSDLGTAGLSPVLKRTVINASGGSFVNTGIFSDGLMKLNEIREVQINVSGGSNGYGIQIGPNNGSSGGALRLTDSTITVQTESGTGYGIYTEASNTVRIEQSQVRAIGSTSYGVDASTAIAQVVINHSEIAGAISTVLGGTVQIGATLLEGGAVAGVTVTCAGVYDESFAFTAGPTCP